MAGWRRNCISIACRSAEPTQPSSGWRHPEAIEYGADAPLFPGGAAGPGAGRRTAGSPAIWTRWPAARHVPFHFRSRSRPPASFGAPERVRQPMLDDFTHTRPLLTDPADRRQFWHAVECWTLAASERLWRRLAERKAGGWIRECHGDLHLGNMVLADADQITIFDCIEFNDDLRWIDVINDLAFLTMDLRFHGAGGLAQRLLNTYLEYTAATSLVRAAVLLPSLSSHGARQDQRHPSQPRPSYPRTGSRYRPRSVPRLSAAGAGADPGADAVSVDHAWRLRFRQIASDRTIAGNIPRRDPHPLRCGTQAAVRPRPPGRQQLHPG
jgi:hypothetical protein